MNSAPMASPASDGGSQLTCELVGDEHRERELEQVVVAGAEELGPEERREAALAEQRELVRRARAGAVAGRCAARVGVDVEAGLHEAVSLC